MVKIAKNGTYSGELELSILNKILNIFIGIYEYQSNIFGEIYKSINIYETLADKAKIIIQLEFPNAIKHFKILKYSFNIKDKSLNNNNKNINNYNKNII